MEETQFDVIVIGGGVMGSSTAYNAGKRGLKTLLLEQFDFLHHRGSSHGESRTIRVTYPQHHYYPLVMDSYTLWQEAQAQVGYQVYFPAHHFDMAPSHHPTMRSLLDYCRAHNIPFQLLRSPEVGQKFSGRINIPDDWVGLSNPHGGIIKPTKAACMYSMTPDEDFVIDFLGGEFGKDVIIGGGFSGHGFKMAPVIGRILVDLALHGDPNGVDISHFTIARFRTSSKL
uniref:Sarcosine oxidase n=1 Tax=Cajanus cajan TaxID=3821 RepID=A0A151R3Y5_CAJCA|nr:putative sarcosine oxidase [Cajanus cajan]